MMNHRFCATCFAVLLVTSFVSASAQEIQPPELTGAEQLFVDQITQAALVGQFSVGGRKNLTPKPERYTILSVTKVGGDDWIVEARITYGQVDVPVPVPVQVLWAGDTPVLQVTDLKIPLMGEGFTARVMFHGNRYAGSWSHGKVGGHMWGLVEKVATDADNASDPSPISPVPGSPEPATIAK